MVLFERNSVARMKIYGDNEQPYITPYFSFETFCGRSIIYNPS